MASRIIRIVFLLALCFGVLAGVSASPLGGKVLEVIDGERLSVLSLNQPLKIKLAGVAVPATGQPYTDIARQHLTDLISAKFVVVRSTGFGPDAFLIGQVFLGDRDIGEQMIRDGVGWYDKSTAGGLSPAERGQYEACETAARTERRGLWQDESPMAPWTFREAQTAKPRTFTAVSPAVEPVPRTAPRAREGRDSVLVTDRFARWDVKPVTAGMPAGKPTYSRISPAGVEGKWTRFAPESRNFSLLAPADAVETSYPLIDAESRLTTMHRVLGSCDGLLYVLMWVTAANDGATDTLVVNSAIDGLVKGLNDAAHKAGYASEVTAKAERDLNIKGYTGKQYSLSGNAGVLRILSKRLGDQRELVMFGVLSPADDRAAVDKILNSLRIGEK